jgi:hypothetical protein
MNMKNRLLFLSLLITSLWCRGEADNAAKPVIAMIDRQNGLTPTLLSVGTNSFTFSVEWTPDVEFPEGWIELMGKLNEDQGWWDSLYDLVVDTEICASTLWHSHYPVEGGVTHGKAIFEVQYASLPWATRDEQKAQLAEKAFFSVVVPDPNEANAWIIEEVRKEMEAEKNAEKAAREMGQAPVETTAGQTPDMNGGQSGAIPPEPPHPGKVEGERPREPNAPVRRWLYLAALPLVLAALYFMRRRKG